MDEQILFHEYFDDWAKTYKRGTVRRVTFVKYEHTKKQLKSIVPDMRLTDLNKRSYQQIINTYAESHARQTVLDFHTHLKAAILDAIDEGLLSRNPTRKVAIKGNAQIIRSEKFLNSGECKKFTDHLDLISPLYSPLFCKGKHIIKVNWDWLILLGLKTGLRLSELLGLTPADFDFDNCILNVDKTFDYKYTSTLKHETKTSSSRRKIIIDAQTNGRFQKLTEGLDENKPIFAPEGQKVFNSTIVSRVKKLCRLAGVTPISAHGLRHTHASILFYNGVSVYSISKRLGHANVTVTQNTYLHIIKELEDKDNDKILEGLEKIG